MSFDQSQDHAPRAIPLYFFADLPNFGDMLSPRIVEWVSGSPVQRVSRDHRGKLLGLGSVLDAARPGDLVWGTGVHPAFFDAYWRGGRIRHARWHRGRIPETDIRVFCTRGPLTRDCLLQLGAEVPTAMGDPALLLPLIQPEVHRPKREIGLIGHYRDKLYDVPCGILEIAPLKPWQEIVADILTCERVISSSLHGIVVAEAYGVPCTWLRPRSPEGIVKYLDYYLSTDRSPHGYHTLTSALAGKTEDSIKADVLAQRQIDLISTFPGQISTFAMDSIVGTSPEIETSTAATPSS